MEEVTLGELRLRPNHRKLTEIEIQNINDIKQKAIELFNLIHNLPTEGMEDGRLKSLSLTAIEESIFWSTKCITHVK